MKRAGARSKKSSSKKSSKKTMAKRSSTSKARTPSRPKVRIVSAKATAKKKPAARKRTGRGTTGPVRRRSSSASPRAARVETDALYVLAQDHRLMEKLFKRAHSDVRAFEPLREELDLHARVEEEIFYPAVEAALGDEGGGIVEEARREHLEVKDLLAELSGLERGGEEFEERLRTLQGAVGRHVLEEEGEMFKRALRALSWERLGELGAEMKARKEDLRTIPALP